MCLDQTSFNFCARKRRISEYLALTLNLSRFFNVWDDRRRCFTAYKPKIESKITQGKVSCKLIVQWKSRNLPVETFIYFLTMRNKGIFLTLTDLFSGETRAGRA